MNALNVMNAMTDWALTSLTAYGAPILLLVAFVGSLGIPFPITIVIVAAGAFSHSGLMDWRVALAACVAGAALADNSEYLAGRFARNWLQKRCGQQAVWRQAQAMLKRQGWWAILITRFWLTPLAPAVNVIAGSRYPFLRFLAFDLAGQLVWAALYGGLGYIFASQWQQVSGALSAFSGLSVGLVILALIVYILMLRRKPQKATKG